MRTLVKIGLALRGFAGLLIALLLLVQVGVVALRYVFSLGWPWAFDLLAYLFLLSVLLPGLSVLLSNASVRVDIFYADYRQKARNRLDRFALLFLLFPAMGYAAWASLGTTLNSWQVLEASPTYGGLPGYFLLKSALTLFFASLALSALILALRGAPYDGWRDAKSDGSKETNDD